MTPSTDALISGRLFTLGFVYVCVCVAHDFLRVSALRDNMEYCCARVSCALFCLHLRISALYCSGVTVKHVPVSRLST